MKRRIRNAVLLLIGSMMLGALLLILIFCLPVDSARAHVEESLYEMIEIREDAQGNTLRRKIVDLKVSFTDALMVQNALEKVEGKNPLEHAMYVYHHDIQEDETTWLTEESLITFLREGSGGLHLREYSKYWHGYLIFLKPLLMCMSWEHVELFLVLVQMALLLAIVFVSLIKKRLFLGIGVAFAFLFMKPLSVWVSLSMNICYLITMTAILVLLLYYEKIERKNWREEVFLLIGVSVAYMDFLTYPIVTLGLPLCFYLALDGAKELTWWKRAKQAFWMCACWCVGYIGMWGMKWVVAEITCRTGTLRNAVWSVIYRTGPLDGYGSAFTGISRTVRDLLKQYDSPLYTAGFWALAAAALASVVWRLIKSLDKNWCMTVLLLGITACFPFVWLSLTQNHTAIHAAFTFRILSVSVMAFWCILSCSVEGLRRKARENEGEE